MIHEAADELRYLLDRGYEKSYALEFVANHHRLRKNERFLLARTIFSGRQSLATKRKCLDLHEARGRDVAVDGFNVLITCEAAIANRAVVCDDGVVRDTEGVFGKYRIGQETWTTLDRICLVLGMSRPHFFFDAQVSRSGRLVEFLKEKRIDAKTEKHVDSTLVKSGMMVATSDSVVIAKVAHFIDVPRQLLLE